MLHTFFTKRGERIDFEIKKLNARGAIADPVVLTAIVSGDSAEAALIMDVFRLLDKNSQKIVIQMENGTSIEYPKNTSKEKLNEIIGLMERMRVKQIEVLNDLPQLCSRSFPEHYMSKLRYIYCND